MRERRDDVADLVLVKRAHGALSAGMADLGASASGALLGHSGSATTARYAHLVESSRKRAAETVSGAIAAALGATATPTLDGQHIRETDSGTVLPFERRA